MFLIYEIADTGFGFLIEVIKKGFLKHIDCLAGDSSHLAVCFTCSHKQATGL
jgi:hypothetical protein